MPELAASRPALGATDLIDTFLGNAALMLNASACALDCVPQPGAPEGIVVGWGMTQPDARQVLLWLRSVLDQQALGEAKQWQGVQGSHSLPLQLGAFPIPAERWPPSVARIGAPNDGEAVAVRLQRLGWIVFLGLAGMLNRPPLVQPRTRAAYIGQITAHLRSLLDARLLAEQRNEYASAFTYSGDGILTVDAQLRITSCNPALERMIAWDARQMIGRFYYDVLRPENAQGEPLGLARCPLVEAFATGEAAVSREIVIRARDGQRIDVAVTAAVAKSPEGVPVSGILNVRDVSRRRENEMLSSTIVSVVSHELQTPIAIIKGYASTLSRPDAIWSGETQRERLRAIEEEADRLSHMVGNLLYASRIQAGGLMMSAAPLDLGEVLASCVRRVLARGVRHQIMLELPESVPTVMADVTRIEEVVMNLIDNAVKYSPAGTSIIVGARVTPHEVIVSVADQGPGIPIREQERVFDRFHRLEGDLTRQTTGAGLGLYICQAIVRAHGGTIGVESELGNGATFAFSLPRSEGNHPAIVDLTS